MRVWNRGWMYSAGYQPSKVRHIDKIERANFIGDLPHASKINDAGVRAAAANDQLGALALGDLFELVIIDGLSLAGHAVRNDFVSLAGKVQVMAMSQVATVGEVESQNSIAGL